MPNSSHPPVSGDAPERRPVVRPPDRPVMVFDGECGFCRFWIERWRAWTRGRVEYVAFQEPEVAERFPELARADCETAVQWIGTDGRIASGAEAVFRSLAGVTLLQSLLSVYRTVPLFARFSEWLYRFVAGHRTGFSMLNRWLWGRSPELPRYQTTTVMLTRAMGLIFLAGFISLWVQIHGLVGEQGILPAGEFMRGVAAYFDQANTGVDRYFRLPTLGWIAAGDTALHVYCLLGVICSVLVLTGWVPAAAMAGCWLLYLSLTGLGQDFLSFQWDVLLIETGFLLALINRWRWRLRADHLLRALPGILLARWLLFRLMLESGAVKLTRGDPTWHNLTALQFHFETQPLPHWISWYVHQLPVWLLKSATVTMFAIELVLPFFIFAPRRLRLLAFAGFAALQFGIIFTGNYGCFNWLTLVLSLALLDDRVFRGIAGRLRLRRVASAVPDSPSRLQIGDTADWKSALRQWVRRLALGAYAAVALLIGLAQLEDVLGSRPPGGGPMNWLRSRAEPFRVVNQYGLFAVMTTSRPELVVEGSPDGIEWRPYVFKYKPGPLERRPPIVWLHMPRLDWQMWFAALQDPRRPPRWLGGFAQRLFERSPDVLELLESDPFPDQPPRFLRVLAYDYHFTSAPTRRNSGQWWLATNRRYYLPILQFETGVSRQE